MSNGDIGSEAICAGCVYGKIVRQRLVPHPQAAWQYARENPGAGAPPVFEMQINFCTNPTFTGDIGGTSKPARDMGTVLSCECFVGRPL